MVVMNTDGYNLLPSIHCYIFISAFASKVKKKLDLPVFNLNRCVEKYKGTRVVTSKHLCAGGEEGHDSCTGDSGND